MNREQKLEEALRDVRAWADSQCPCHEETPNPCTLCGASVENLEACKSVESVFPRKLLRKLDTALSAPKAEAGVPIQKGCSAIFEKGGEMVGVQIEDEMFSAEPCPVCAKPFASGHPCAPEFTDSPGLAEQWETHPQTDKVIPLYTSPVPALTDEAVERAVDAIEGELGGVAATKEQARTILEYALLAAFPSKGEGQP